MGPLHLYVVAVGTPDWTLPLIYHALHPPLRWTFTHSPRCLYVLRLVTLFDLPDYILRLRVAFDLIPRLWLRFGPLRLRYPFGYVVTVVTDLFPPDHSVHLIWFPTLRCYGCSVAVGYFGLFCTLDLGIPRYAAPRYVGYSLTGWLRLDCCLDYTRPTVRFRLHYNLTLLCGGPRLLLRYVVV